MNKISVFLIISSFLIISCSSEDTSIYPLTYKYGKKTDFTEYHSYLIGKDSTYKEIDTKKDYKDNMEIITDGITGEDWDNYIVIENDSTITFKNSGEDPLSTSYKIENGFLVLTDKRARGVYSFENEKRKLLCYSLGQFAISKKYEESSIIRVYQPHTFDRDLLLKNLIRSSYSFSGMGAFTKKIPTQYYLMPNDTLCMVWGKAFYNLN